MRSAAAFDDLVLLCRRTCGDSRSDIRVSRRKWYPADVPAVGPAPSVRLLRLASGATSGEVEQPQLERGVFVDLTAGSRAEEAAAADERRHR